MIKGKHLIPHIPHISRVLTGIAENGSDKISMCDYNGGGRFFLNFIILFFIENDLHDQLMCVS